MTIELSAWMIPAAITAISLGYAARYDDGWGYLSGIGNLFMLIPALVVSCVSWIVYAVLK